MKKISPFISFLLVIVFILGLISIQAVATDTSITRYTVLVLDESGSMSGEPIAAQRKAAKKFCEALFATNDENYIAIVSIDSSSYIKTDFTNNLDELLKDIEDLDAYGGTNTNSALEQAGSLLSQVPESAIRNVVVCSDGLPESGSSTDSGQYSAEDISYYYMYANAAYNTAKSVLSNYTVYSLGFFHSLSGKELSFGQRFMKDIASSDANYYLVEDPDALEFSFGEVADNIINNNSPKKIDFEFSNQKSSCYYTDDYFSDSSYIYNQSLGTMSLAFALSAFGVGSYDNYSVNAKNLLEKIGCKPDAIKTNNWFTVKPTTDSIGVIIGSKPLDNSDCTLIAVAVRGGGYEREWASNFTIGRNGQHDGFNTAKNNVIKEIKAYIKNKGISGNIKLWITGYSRAAATANLVGGALDSGEMLSDSVNYDYDDIYTYCFETPAGAITKDIKNSKLIFDDKDRGVCYPRYNNIFSIINSSDPVPYVAPAALGFGRYGLDKYLPSQQSTSNYYTKRDNMIEFLKKMTTDDYVVDDFQMKKLSVNKKIVSKKLIVVVDDTKNNYSQGTFLSNYVTILSKEFLVTRDNFVNNYQDEIREVCSIIFGSSQKKTKKLLDSFIEQAKANWPKLAASLLWNSGFKNDEAAALQIVSDWLVAAVNKAGITDYDEETLNKAGIYLADLAAAVAINHPNYLTTAIVNGKGLGAAHYPDLCLAWMQSMDPNYSSSNTAQYNTGSYRVIRINCAVDVMAYNNEGVKVAEITNEEPQAVSGSSIISSINEDGEKIIVLPIDEDYTIHITARENDQVCYGVDEYCAIAGDFTRVLKFDDVDLKKGEKLTGIIPAYSDEETSDDLQLMDGSKAKYSLIAPNNEEVELTDITGEKAVNSYYSVNVSSSDEEKGYVSGSGLRQYGNYAQVEAIAFEGNTFVGWYEGDKLVSTSETYRFQVEKDTTLIAKFDTEDEPNPSDEKPAPVKPTKPSETVEPSESPKPSESTKPSSHTDSCPSKHLTDMKNTEGKWFHEGVDYAISNGYMSGVENNLFAPNRAVSRAMVAQILYAAEGKPAVIKSAGFSDVKSGKWYTDAINWAASKGVVAGYPDRSFKPDKAVTREELATILYKYAQTKTDAFGIAMDALDRFQDKNQIHAYAVNAMEWAVTNKIISGTDQGLEPRGSATRAQLAVILQALDKVIK